MAFVGDLRAGRFGHTFGNKAANLAFLRRNKLLVPDTICISWRAFERAQGDPATTLQLLRQELAARIDSSSLYAVRSSADLEDGGSHSFAGQFATVLDVRGLAEIMEAIKTVWDSAGSPAVQSYLERNGKGGTRIRMGVIIQPMVPALFSGVSFSRNPITGAAEVVVEAVEGRGDRLAQAGVTPERWIGKWGGWRYRPTGSNIPIEVMSEVVSGTIRIARMCGKPVDLEWVFDGRQLVWVQLRGVTGTTRVNIYSNRMAREMLPGLVLPLIWSVNIPLVNGAWVRILQELIGKMDIRPEDLARRFYARAYFNMGAIGRIFERIGMPWDSLELLMGIDVEGGTRPPFRMPLQGLKHLPRLVKFVVGKWRFERTATAFLREMPLRYAPVAEQCFRDVEPQQALACIDTLFTLNSQTAYCNIIIPLLFQVHHKALQARLARGGIAIEQCDLTSQYPELADLSPGTHLERLHDLFMGLPSEAQEEIRRRPFANLRNVDGAAVFLSAVESFMTRFGHLSDIGTDFSSTPWRENPDLVLRMVLDYAPPARSSAMQRPRFDELPSEISGRRITRMLYRRTRKYQLYREQIGTLFSYGYGLFRPLFLTLGKHLEQRGILVHASDIFYLTRTEVEAAVTTGGDHAAYRARVAARWREMEDMRTVDVPAVIYGDEQPPLVAGSKVLCGVPTARGCHCGPARVVRGLEDLPRVRDGDVLVVPFADVSWTPLFARAGAVVSESGGMLSHASIIAREYGIPAVVSVQGACSMADGTMVSVDAFQGTVTQIDQHEGG
jgi:phosphohistidine swiveling domain-containing protein